MRPLAVVPILLALALQSPATAFAQAPPAVSPSAANNCTGAHGSADINGDYVDDIVIGDPAATVSGHKGAGVVQVRYGLDYKSTAAKITLAQDDPLIGGAVGTNNGFGSTIKEGPVDGDACADVVIGVPGQALGTAKAAGEVVVVFGSPAGLGQGRPALVLRPGEAGLPGAPATGERFGSVLALRDDASRSTEPGFVAIGVPLRDVKGLQDAGAVDYVSVAADGAVQSARTITEASVGVPGTPQAGDHFGYALAPGFYLKGCRGIWCDDVMVGEPGKSKAAGAMVSVAEPGAGSPYTGSKVWSQNTTGVQGTSEAGDGFGSSLHER